ncbi:DNA polymerase delta subunit 4 isoform X2 [Impatiens glandulifera]|uniref:DNA polymerase delta subunit 4 isoform X2 n=1 Tax=Impatiens glandulifera TaxID=253017 RepID=UPI001FB08079|nr:DNA polymerase delta subunit 4 isoform X2 [Impatiens glandulifera]
MASSTRGKGEMKGYFKQKKNTSIGKKSALSLKSKAKIQPPIEPNDVCDEKEQILKEFDMNMLYGPCLGISRIDRWERANKQFLNPPKEIESLLKEAKFSPNCLWDDRV